MPVLEMVTPETDIATDEAPAPGPICVAIGIMAWNEENSIPSALNSLFAQSLFGLLAARGERAEIIVLPNGCTDRTATVAAQTMTRLRADHPHAEAITARVCELEQPGRNNAWNRFVHEFSAREARFVFLMDADILFHGEHTLRNMVCALERDPEAMVVTDRPRKEIEFKARKTLRDRLSLATSAMNRTGGACFSGQCYGLRAPIARNLYLPRDAGAPDDGFFKQVVCTDFLTRPVNPRRVVLAPDAAHIFEAYTSPAEVLRNQRRQMIGQTIVHVMIEYLKTRPRAERVNLAATLRRLDARDPDWVKKLLARHVAHARFFWELFPGLLTFRLRRCWAMGGWRWVAYLPAAVLATGVTMIACWSAFRFLKRGHTHFWPKAARGALLRQSAST
ncbi:MAG: glycosyltransferase family 2 protein [Opitutae bacterium]|nr:glycosyltransferase family 2 protein [Opitutae bacterium]